MIEYMKKIPKDVLINKIIPLTYKPQPKELLLDIYSYNIDYNIIQNYYGFFLNDFILLFDFFNYNINNNKLLYEKINKYDNELIERNIRLILGSMTPIDRTNFINKYII